MDVAASHVVPVVPALVYGLHGCTSCCVAAGWGGPAARLGERPKKIYQTPPRLPGWFSGFCAIERRVAQKPLNHRDKPGVGNFHVAARLTTNPQHRRQRRTPRNRSASASASWSDSSRFCFPTVQSI